MPNNEKDPFSQKLIIFYLNLYQDFPFEKHCITDSQFDTFQQNLQLLISYLTQPIAAFQPYHESYLMKIQESYFILLDTLKEIMEYIPATSIPDLFFFKNIKNLLQKHLTYFIKINDYDTLPSLDTYVSYFSLPENQLFSTKNKNLLSKKNGHSSLNYIIETDSSTYYFRPDKNFEYFSIKSSPQKNRRNVATSRMAKLLHISSYVANSQTGILYDQKTKHCYRGNFMRGAKGITLHDYICVSSHSFEAKQQCFQQICSPYMQKALTTLEVFDWITNESGRHTKNCMIDIKGNVIQQIQAIDNDRSFFTSPSLASHGRQGHIFSDDEQLLLCIDADFAKHITNLSESNLLYLLCDLLRKDEIISICQRLSHLKKVIQKYQQDSAKQDNSFFFPTKQDWENETLVQKRHHFLLNTPFHYYTKLCISLCHSETHIFKKKQMKGYYQHPAIGNLYNATFQFYCLNKIMLYQAQIEKTNQLLFDLSTAPVESLQSKLEAFEEQELFCNGIYDIHLPNILPTSDFFDDPLICFPLPFEKSIFELRTNSYQKLRLLLHHLKEELSYMQNPTKKEAHILKEEINHLICFTHSFYQTVISFFERFLYPNQTDFSENTTDHFVTEFLAPPIVEAELQEQTPCLEEKSKLQPEPFLPSIL